MLNKDYMKKWQRIEEYLLINDNIPKRILNRLEKAYKNVSEQEEESIIDKTYKELFKSNMEAKNDVRRV